MKIHPLRYIMGYLLIEIDGYYTERFLNLCRYHKIYLWNIESIKNNYRMNISVSDFRKLKPIIRKTKTKVRIKKRFGFPFFAFKYRKRHVFVFCLIISCLILYLSSLFLWEINLKGNSTISNETLMEYLYSKNISVGRIKSNIDCASLVKNIRKDFEKIIWVSAHIDGTQLIIHIKENDDDYANMNYDESFQSDKYYTNIISDTKGTIINIVTRKGVTQVHIGDDINVGDILICGAVPILNDAKEIIDYKYETPDADIIVKTTINYNNKINSVHKKLVPTKKRNYCLIIQLGNRTIQFGSTNNKYSNYNVITQVYKISNHISLSIIKRIKCDKFIEKYSEKEYVNILSYEFDKFCRNLEKKGVQILENSVKIYKENSCILARGKIEVLKSIGKTSTERKLTHGNIRNSN